MKIKDDYELKMSSFLKDVIKQYRKWKSVGILVKLKSVQVTLDTTENLDVKKARSLIKKL